MVFTASPGSLFISTRSWTAMLIQISWGKSYHPKRHSKLWIPFSGHVIGSNPVQLRLVGGDGDWWLPTIGLRFPCHHWWINTNLCSRSESSLHVICLDYLQANSSPKPHKSWVQLPTFVCNYTPMQLYDFFKATWTLQVGSMASDIPIKASCRIWICLCLDTKVCLSRGRNSTTSATKRIRESAASCERRLHCCWWII